MKLFSYFALACASKAAAESESKAVAESTTTTKATLNSADTGDSRWMDEFLCKLCVEDSLDKDDVCSKLCKTNVYANSDEHQKDLLVKNVNPRSGEKPPTDQELQDGFGMVEKTIQAEQQRLNPEDVMLLQARKLKQLKVLILWLQPEHRFARYCFYGCWCLPDNDHKLFTVGYGKPVDNIDGSCKRQSQCYDCAQIDHPDRVCDPNIMGYSFKLHQDPTDPNNHWKKSIECTDQPGKGSKGSCRRSICECDKKLAEDLRTYFHEWDINNHQEQGTFDSATRCIVEGCKSGNCGGRSVECCGNLGSGPRMPYKTDGRRKCCGDKTYDSTFQECCEDGSLAAIGAC